MSRAAAFRQADVSRLVRAAKAAGMTIARIETTPDGKISLVTDAGTVTDDADEKELAELRRKNGLG